MHNLLTLVSYAGKDFLSNDMSMSYLYSDYENAINVGWMQHIVVREEKSIAKPVTYHHHRRLVSMSDSTNDK